MRWLISLAALLSMAHVCGPLEVGPYLCFGARPSSASIDWVQSDRAVSDMCDVTLRYLGERGNSLTGERYEGPITTQVVTSCGALWEPGWVFASTLSELDFRDASGTLSTQVPMRIEYIDEGCTNGPDCRCFGEVMSEWTVEVRSTMGGSAPYPTFVTEDFSQMFTVQIASLESVVGTRSDDTPCTAGFESLSLDADISMSTEDVRFDDVGGLCPD